MLVICKFVEDVWREGFVNRGVGLGSDEGSQLPYMR